MTTHTITPQPYRDLYGVFTATLSPAGCHVGVYAVRLERGARMPTERHPSAERIIAYGPLCVTVDGHTHALDAGQCVDVPAGAEHEVANPTARTVEYMSIATPGFGEAPPVTVPASVVEAMATLPRVRDPFRSIGDAETRVGLAVAMDGDEEATDAAVVDRIDEAVAFLLHARAILTAGKPVGGA